MCHLMSLQNILGAGDAHSSTCQSSLPVSFIVHRYNVHCYVVLLVWIQASDFHSHGRKHPPVMGNKAGSCCCDQTPLSAHHPACSLSLLTLGNSCGAGQSQNSKANHDVLIYFRLRIKKKQMMMTLMNGKDGYRHKSFFQRGNWGLL